MTDWNGAGSSGATGGVLVLLALLALAAFAPAASGADYGIAEFSVRAIDAEGNPENRAGSHPNRLQIGFALNVEDTGTTPRDLEFDLPPGLGNNPEAVPLCPRDLFDKGEECPPESQVGELRFNDSETGVPLFSVEPTPDEIAALGSTPGFDVPMEMELRPDDFGVTFKANDLPDAPFTEGVVELWGVPADRQVGTSIPRRPFMTLPTTCEPLTMSFRTRSWLPGAPWLSASADTGGPLTDCASLSFEPQLDLAFSNPVADSPSGMSMDISVPENEDPDGRASAQIRDMTMRFPDGVTVSPGGAQTVGVCSDSQAGLGRATEPACPPASRVGTVEFDTSASSKPLAGAVYLGEEHPGERFRMIIIVSAPGFIIKFAGAMQADPATGRLSMAVRNLPQMPLRRLALSMDGGPGALLATPLECGPATASTRFDPYGGSPAVESTASVPIGSNPPSAPCTGVPPFAPTVEVTGAAARAGRPTSLSMRLLRRDGEQLPRRFEMTLPQGLSATVGALEPCPDSALATGKCPDSSKIARAVAEVGSGPQPAALAGDAYLTGPYRGAPFGMMMVFRAALGPFNLGELAVRTAMRLDRRSGRVTVETDRMPAFVEGVPVRFRSIGMELDRGGFMLAPTSCKPASVDVGIEAMGGSSTTLSAPFRVRGCRKLGFDPAMSMTLTGRSQLVRRGNPGMQVSTRLRKGDTNLRGMRLWLPPFMGFDVGAIKEICARSMAVEGDCSARARVGTASARTPLFDKPLRGSMYMVQPPGDGLPNLWLSVAAMGVEVNMRARTVVRDGRVALEMQGMPDLPISSFSMRTSPGKSGLITLTQGLCVDGRPRRLAFPIALEGQNGAKRNLRARIEARPRCAS